jgi:hypothetical protein
VNRRESLQGAIQQGTSAKDAKAPSLAEDPWLLHLLHADYPESRKAGSLDDEPDQKSIGRALGVLNRVDVRIMRLEGAVTIGVWSDLDGPAIRAAIGAFGSGRLPIRYLDGAGIPRRSSAALRADTDDLWRGEQRSESEGRR